MLARVLYVVVAVSAVAAVAAGVSTPGATFRAVLLQPQLTTDGDHRVELKPQGSHPTLITGDDATSMHLSHRPRISPSLIFNVDRGSLSKATLDYGSDAFAVPPASIVFSDHRGGRILWQSALPEFLGKDEKSTTLPLAETFASVDAFALETSIELTIAHQEVTTFTYVFEEGIPNDIMTSEQTYDLLPHNTTMLTKFMLKIRKTPTHKMSIWVSRKPTAPDFSLLVFVDGDLHSESNVEHDPTSTDALGFDIDIEDSLRDFFRHRVEFVVHFYERHRQITAVARIPNLRNSIDRLRKTDLPLAKETFETDVLRTSVQLSYHRGTNFVGLKVIQGAAMQDVQISLSKVESDGNRTLLLREGDDVIPYYADSESDIQYGWDDALPAKTEQMQNDAGVDLLDGPVEVIITYNPGVARDFTVGRVLERWIESNGGKLNHLNFDYLDEKDHSFESKHPLRSRANLKAGDIVAQIPYSTLVTSRIVERSAWSSILHNHSDDHRKHVEDEDVHPDADKIMKMTAAVYMHLFDESANFRPYFNTFTASANKLAPYFTEEEVSLFSFDPQIRVELERMKALWNVEVGVLQKATAKLPRSVDPAAYFRVRSQVETRLLNLTDQLVLIPVVDLLTHDDAPNCEVEYDDEQHSVVVRTKSAIAAGTPLTLDIGEKQKTGLDFLVQFGFVPQGAVEAATIPTPKGPIYLTRDDASLARIREAFDDAADDLTSKDVKKAILDVHAKLSSAMLPPTRHASQEVRRAAERLLQQEREVLAYRAKNL